MIWSVDYDPGQTTHGLNDPKFPHTSGEVEAIKVTIKVMSRWRSVVFSHNQKMWSGHLETLNCPIGQCMYMCQLFLCALHPGIGSSTSGDPV